METHESKSRLTCLQGGAGGGAQSLGAGPAAYQPNTLSYLTVGGCGGVVAEGDVGGTAVLQRGQLLFSVTRTLFGTLQMLPEFHNLLDETEGEREGGVRGRDRRPPPRKLQPDPVWTEPRPRGEGVKHACGCGHQAHRTCPDMSALVTMETPLSILLVHVV